MPSPTQPHPFNGINAATGDYGLTLSADQLVQRVFGHASTEALKVRQAEYQDAKRSARKSTKRGTREGVDGTDLGQAGWGVIFAYADPRVDAIQETLQPLLTLRAAWCC